MTARQNSLPHPQEGRKLDHELLGRVPEGVFTRAVASLILSLATLALALSSRSTFAADRDWVTTPYSAEIWIDLPPDFEIRQTWSGRLDSKLLQQIQSLFRVSMRCEIRSAPPDLQNAVLQNDESIVLSNFIAPDHEILKKDKLYLVTIRRHATDVRIGVREFDCRTQLWGPYIEKQAPLAELDVHIASAVFDAFRCLGRVESLDKKNSLVTLQMRAGLLADQHLQPNSNSLSLSTSISAIPSQDSVLVPVIRKTKRDGSVASVDVVPWTLLQVTDPTAGDDALVSPANVKCRVESAFRQPLRIRTARRGERLALLATPTHSESVVKLESEQAPHKPLLGYEVFAGLPGQKSRVFLGRTGWDGTIRLRRDKSPLKVLYVKHGAEVIRGRFPCAIGLQEEFAIRLPDQRERLRAEAFVQSLKDRLLDKVIRREIEASKIRRLLSREAVTRSDILRAEKYLDVIREINRGRELLRELDRRERAYESANRSVQSRIDNMLNQTKRAIRSTISPNYVKKLENEIASAGLRAK